MAKGVRVLVYVWFILCVAGFVTADVSCKSGWIESTESESCLKIVADDYRDWDSARSACQAEGGDLAKIINSDMNDFITSAVDSTYGLNYWIGLHYVSDLGYYVWLDELTEADFTNWALGQAESDQACVLTIWNYDDLLDDWGNRDCGDTEKYICEVYLDDIPKVVCPSGWIESRESETCLRLFDQAQLNWTEARTACQAQGGDLVKIVNSAMNDFIGDAIDLTSRGNVNFWIGLHYDYSLGFFVWLDESTETELESWYSWQSNGNEDCVVTAWDYMNYNKWGDLPCDYELRYICESIAGNIPAAYCPSGWIESPDSGTCIKLFSDDPMSWDEARAACQTQGGDLIKIANSQMNNFIAAILEPIGTPNYWIGLHYNSDDECYHWLEETTKAMFENWADDEASRNGDCVMMAYSGYDEWGDSDCDGSNKYICEIRPSVLCPTDWIKSPSSTCVKVYTTPTFSWSDSRRACQAEGGDLVKIDDSEMNYFIAGLVSYDKDFWIGLHYDYTLGSYVWLGETTKAEFTNWASGQADFDENCVVTSWNYDDTWGDYSCDTSAKYICELFRNSFPPVLCPSGWVESSESGSCIKLFTDLLSWEEARSACRDEGGDLVKIVNTEMNDFIGDILEAIGDKSYWIGLHLNNNGVYAWLDESIQALYIDWYRGEPSFGDGCVATAFLSDTYDEWGEYACDSINKYICEIFTVADKAFCERDWIESPESGTCIRLFTNDLSWDDARSDCQRQGGDLVKIINKDMNDFIADIIIAVTGYYCWIGIHYNTTLDCWVWLNETTEAEYVNWYPGEGEVSDDTCADIPKSYSGEGWYQWSDIGCDNDEEYICEKNPSVTCPAGWTQNTASGSCIKVYRDNPLTWDDARVACQDEGGDLVKIESAEANNIVADLLQPYGELYYWTGLHYDTSLQFYVWLDDIREATFYSWDPTQSDDAGGCVLTASYSDSYDKWLHDSCDRTLEFICEVLPHRFSPVTCPSDWIESAESRTCIKIFTEEKLSWEGSRAACQDEGGDLVKIVNEEMNDFIANIVELIGYLNYWIGLHYDSDLGYHVWLDETSETTLNIWYLGEPDPNEDCVVTGWAYDYLNEWGDYDCDYLNNYICEIDSLTDSTMICPSDWIMSVESRTCLKTYDEELNWYEARASCQGLGGDLVKMVNEEMNNFIGAILESFNQTEYWIGLHLDSSEGYYVWLDESTETTFDKWHEGRPLGNECVVTAFEKDSYNTWGDYDCANVTNKYICEFNSTVTCPSDWTLSKESRSCVKVVVEDLEWQDARIYCQAEGGDLVKVRNAEMNEFLAVLIAPDQYKSREYFWIGLHYESKSDVYVWLDETTEVEYTNWGPNEEGPEAYRCVGIGVYSSRLDEWATLSCSADYFFICEIFPDIMPSVDCPSGWIESVESGTCIKFFSDVELTWDVARATCQALGGDLVKIDSQETNDFIGALLESYGENDYWIGLHYDESLGYYVWLDETSEVSETYWYSLLDDNQGCVVTGYVMYNTWGDQPCDNTINKYICELPSKRDSVTCPYDWIVSPESGTCIKITSDSASWDESRAACQGEGGDLVKIVNGRMNDFIAAILELTSDTRYWIGLHYNASLGFDVWLNETTEAEFSSWSSDQSDRSDDCVSMALDNGIYNQWETVDCSNRNLYICEIVPTVTCRSGWLESQASASCLEFTDNDLTWDGAREYCQTQGGDLVKIVNSDMNFFITNVLYILYLGFVSIGLHYDDTLGYYVWLNETTEAQYTNWYPGDPMDPETNQCTITRSYHTNNVGEWMAMECDTTQEYICEYFPQPFPKVMCPYGWIESSQSETCIRLVTSPELTWEEARDACRDEGGDLVKIINEEMNDFIGAIISFVGNINYWIGLRYNSSMGIYVWLDEASETEHTQWYYNQPDGQGDCVVTGWNYNYYNTWGDYLCDYKAFYICEISPLEVATTLKPVVTTTKTEDLSLLGTTLPTELQTESPTDDEDLKTSTSSEAPAVATTLKPVVTTTETEDLPLPGTALPTELQTESPTDDEDLKTSTSSEGLSGGAVAGIVILVLVFLIPLVYLGQRYYRHRQLPPIFTNGERINTVSFVNKSYSNDPNEGSVSMSL